ncbi:MAG TPA: hypothetical protein VIJ38_06920 [Acidobacteriaceae bacterium]
MNRSIESRLSCSRWMHLRGACVLGLLLPLLCGQYANAQGRHPADSSTSEQSGTAPRTRLILKDGSYQLVLGYKVIGNVVRYRSAERNGETEDVPLSLVDLPATERWQSDHAKVQSNARPVLTPELEREEAARRALTPEVAPDLHLPEEDSVLALDTYRGTPELVPVPQEGSDLNKETAHAALKSMIDPASVAHRILSIPGSASDIQLHVNGPVFYVRIGDNDDDEDTGGALTVDTDGAAGRATPSGGEAKSRYVIGRLDVRADQRIVSSFRLGQLGTGSVQPDVIEMTQDILPGGVWMKLTPDQSLQAGEYALIEVLSNREVNLNVWDFGVHANAKENVEAVHPEAEKPATLERRGPV